MCLNVRVVWVLLVLFFVIACLYCVCMCVNPPRVQDCPLGSSQSA